MELRRREVGEHVGLDLGRCQFENRDTQGQNCEYHGHHHGYALLCHVLPVFGTIPCQYRSDCHTDRTCREHAGKRVWKSEGGNISICVCTCTEPGGDVCLAHVAKQSRDTQSRHQQHGCRNWHVL